MGLIAGVIPTGLQVAYASIRIQPGIYEVPVRVLIKGETPPVALFNRRTRSSLELTLKGKTIPVVTSGLSGWWVKIRVSQRIMGSQGEAEVLEWKPLGERRVPVLVGNDFQEIVSGKK